MEIRKYGHSCLLVGDKGHYLLIDPGDFSFREPFGSLTDLPPLSAILITHNHGDHADPDTLKALLARNEGIAIYGNEHSQVSLAMAGITVNIFEKGSKDIGDFRVEAMAASHDPRVLAPVPANTAYRINGMLVHPGDSLDIPLRAWSGTKVLALPVSAPWASRADSAELVDEMKPQIVIPIHDGYTIERFRINNLSPYKRHVEAQGIALHALNTSADVLTA